MAIYCKPELRLRLLATAQELAAPDLLLRGGAVWNAFTGEVVPADIAICGDRIAKVGGWAGPIADSTRVVEAAGRVAVPGYIEPHTHPWPFANPLSLGEAALCRGTTCLVYDDLLLHLALGPERLSRLTAALSAAALPHVFWVARFASQSRFDGEEAAFAPAVLGALLAHDQFLGTAEMTRWTDLLEPRRAMRLVTILEETRRLGKFNDGHLAGASPRRLAALATVGIRSCHEAISGEEALERLRQGLWVLLRNSSLREDLEQLLGCLAGTAFHERIAFTTDGAAESHVEDKGFTDHLIRVALGAGVAPGLAYRMATLNPASFLGLDEDLGAVAPGRLADVNLLPGLEQPTPDLVICRGRVAARAGVLAVPAPSATFPWAATYADCPTVLPDWPARMFPFPAAAPNPFPAGRLTNGAITREAAVPLTPQGGGLWPATPDAVMLAAGDREGTWITRGVVENLAPGLAALATTYTTTAGVLVLGRSPEAMADALVRLRRQGGGIVLSSTAGERWDFALPMAGIHGDLGFAAAAQEARRFHQAMQRCGYVHVDPKYTLLFLTCDMLPELRAIEAGWIRVKTGEVLWPAQRLTD